MNGIPLTEIGSHFDAAGVRRVSRQRIHQLVNSGKLEVTGYSVVGQGRRLYCVTRKSLNSVIRDRLDNNTRSRRRVK